MQSEKYVLICCWCIGSWWGFFCLILGMVRITECCLASGFKVKYFVALCCRSFLPSRLDDRIMRLAIFILRFIDCIFIFSNDPFGVLNHSVYSNVRSFCSAWISLISPILSFKFGFSHYMSFYFHVLDYSRFFRSQGEC